MPNVEKSPGVGESFVLDASAVLALIRGEPGAGVVSAVLPRARIHAVNIAEVVKKLVEVQVPSAEIETSLDELQVPVIEEFTVKQALSVGKLAAAGRKYGLSLGDCTCLGAAKWNDSTAVTAERRWAQMPDVEVRILLIR